MIKQFAAVWVKIIFEMSNKLGESSSTYVYGRKAMLEIDVSKLKFYKLVR